MFGLRLYFSDCHLKSSGKLMPSRRNVEGKEKKKKKAPSVCIFCILFLLLTVLTCAWEQVCELHFKSCC